MVSMFLTTTTLIAHSYLLEGFKNAIGRLHASVKFGALLKWSGSGRSDLS